MDDTLWNMGDVRMNWDKYECDGQMSIFDILHPKPKEDIFPCDDCIYNGNGCCSYSTRDDYCVLGDKRIPKPKCQYSGHVCNKENVFAVADTLDLEKPCPHICCRGCDNRLCGARCNGAN